MPRTILSRASNECVNWPEEIAYAGCGEQNRGHSLGLGVGSHFSKMTPDPISPALTATELANLVADWSYLIERDRVWSPSLLAATTTRR